METNELPEEVRKQIEKGALEKYSDGVRLRGDWMGRHQIEGFREGAKFYYRLALQSKEEEIANLKTVMIAAAEEIQAHWQAHCDEEGYGPTNLMHRLEKGIPAKYGYTTGAFANLEEQLKAKDEEIAKLNLLNRQAFYADKVVLVEKIDSLTSENNELKKRLSEIEKPT